MNEKTFRRALFILLIVCILVTIAHFTYDVFAYRNCSVIYFVARELWGNAV